MDKSNQFILQLIQLEQKVQSLNAAFDNNHSLTAAEIFPLLKDVQHAEHALQLLWSEGVVPFAVSLELH